MNIRSSSCLFLFLLLSGCDPQLVDDPIPFASFSPYTINLSLPEYSTLRQDGGFKATNAIGIRGVFIYRVSATVFRVYERNCSFHPNDACATVDMHASNLYFVDPCCNSTFNLEEGQPTGGPAWRPLRQYRTELTSSVLTVTDEVIN